ncbi:methyltransferase, partial [Pseudomonas viridiflava]|uniref:methyltransferase n=1 Tax=Pseudomonas viridiflava TaxID=33069 RepID=UPI0013CE3FDA
TLLDPCVGPATFPSALSRHGIKGVSIHAYDVDIKMMDLSRKWASDNTSMINFYLEDYLLSKPVREYDYAVLNPPYIRQEWIERKTEYREKFKKEFN